jgi:hypothetical protein
VRVVIVEQLVDPKEVWGVGQLYDCAGPARERAGLLLVLALAGLAFAAVAGLVAAGDPILVPLATADSGASRCITVQCCPQTISGRAESERRSFIRYDKHSRAGTAGW